MIKKYDTFELNLLTHKYYFKYNHANIFHINIVQLIYDIIVEFYITNITHYY